MYFRRSQNGFSSPKGYISFGAIYVLAFHVLCLEGCVKKLKDDNGCLIDKQVVIQEGEYYTTPACSKLCSCKNGHLSCNNDYKCGANAECLQENSTYQCTCKEGFLRIGDTCVSICSTNEKYGNCSCETSCSNPQPCVPCAQGQHCYCPSGFFLQEQDCVRQEDCGCFMDGMIVPEGHAYIASGCSRKCSCIKGSLTCDDNFECGPNATCMQQNNTHECRCNVGYSLVGETCVSICSNNEVFGNCTCEKSCNNPEVCEICDQSQRCYCRSGFFLQDQDCVRQEDCGCFIDGILLSDGETYTSPGCSRRCACFNNTLTCEESYKCGSNAYCSQQQNNAYECTCNAGYSPVGDTCVSICLTNEMFGNCTCETSCRNPQVCDSCDQDQRCYCPDGFYRNGQACVAHDECSCYIDGIVIPPEGSYINSDCSRKCFCQSDHLWCDSYSCDPHATCSESNGTGSCHCSTGYIGDGLRCARPKDCYEVASTVGYHGDGVYFIAPRGSPEFQAYCDMQGGRWTVIQRRNGGRQNFNQGWNEYKRGFGSLTREFWLGLEKIYYLTRQKTYKLRIVMETSNRRRYEMTYDSFRIENENSAYRLSRLGTARGSAGHDSMRHHVNARFSTHNRDYDGWGADSCDFNGHCAKMHEGGWWYKHRSRYEHSGCNLKPTGCRKRRWQSCAKCNLNGVYRGGDGTNIFWDGIPGPGCHLRFVEMKLLSV